MQVWWLLRAIGAVNPVCVPAYQTAVFRQDLPDAPVNFTGFSSLTGAGESSCASFSLTSAVATKFWIRFGLAVRSSSAALCMGDLGMQAAFVPLGQSLGASMVNTLVDSATPSYTPICGFVPTILFTKLRLAFQLEVCAGSASWKIAYRTAPTSMATAGSWNPLSSETPRKTVGPGCTGELAQSLTATDFWVQFGIGTAFDGGTTPGMLTLQTLLGVRK